MTWGKERIPRKKGNMEKRKRKIRKDLEKKQGSE
jgi:hypothetical protein